MLPVVETRRAAQVTAFVARQVALHLAASLDMEVLLPRPHGLPRWRTIRQLVNGGPARVRHVLEELGPTFVKLGQVLSTRPDLLPPALEAELSRLQDGAPPEPYAAVVAELTDELGADPGVLFAEFSPTPLAAASIGQVHAARLHDGRDVVVKIRRPGIVPVVTEDLDVLRLLARSAQRVSRSLAERYDPAGLVDEFATTLMAELDYVAEGHHADRVRTAFAHDESVRVPEIHWDLTTSAVLTMEHIWGMRLWDLAALDAAGVERSALAARFARIFLEMVFEHDFFHADPHPGNFFVEPSGRIGIVDFGMVGEVAPHLRDGLGVVLLAVAGTDPHALTDALLRLGVASARMDIPRLERDLGRFLERYSHVPLGDLAIGPVLMDLMNVIRAHRLRMPRELALLMKTVVMCEGVAAHLDPAFRLPPLLLPYAARRIAAANVAATTADAGASGDEDRRQPGDEHEQTEQRVGDGTGDGGHR